MPNSTFVVYQTPTSSYGNQSSYATPAGLPPNLPANPMPWVEPTVSLSKLQKEVRNILESDDSMKPYNEQLTESRTKREQPLVREEDHIAQRRLLGIGFEPENTRSSLANSLANPLRFTEELYRPRQQHQMQKHKIKPETKRETIDEALARNRTMRMESQMHSYTNNRNRPLDESEVLHSTRPNSDRFNNNQGLQYLPRGPSGNNSINPEMEEPRQRGLEPLRMSQRPAVHHARYMDEEQARRHEMESLVPILTKPGYFTKPPMDELRRMDPGHLKVLEHFEIYNQHGSVEFYGPVDVTEVNIDRDVSIDRHGVEVYPDELYTERGQLKKPEQGTKLNRVATITLCNIPAKFDDVEANRRHFVQGCQKIGATFQRYDMTTKELTFQVEHFTRYALDTDADTEEQNETANNSDKILNTSNMTTKTVVKRRNVPSVPLLLQIQKKTPAPGQAAVALAATTEPMTFSPPKIGELEHSEIEDGGQSDIVSGIEIPSPRPGILLTKQPQVQQPGNLERTKTVNELLGYLNYPLHPPDTEVDSLLWGDDQESLNDEDTVEDVIISIPERQVEFRDEHQGLIGQRESKSPFQTSDFISNRARVTKAATLNRSASNQEGLIFDELKKVCVIDNSTGVAEFPPQHGFGIEPEVLQKVAIVRKNDFPPNTWTALSKETKKIGVLTRLLPSAESTFGHPTVVIRPSSTANRYIFTPKNEEDSLNPLQSFGMQISDITSFGTPVPNLYKVPIYIAQILDSNNYPEAVLFDLVNVLFGLPRLRLKKAKSLTLAGFNKEIPEFYQNHMDNSSRQRAADHKRYFGLLLSQFLRQKGSKNVYQYDNLFLSEDLRDPSKSIFTKSTVDFGSKIATLEDSIFGGNRFAQQQSPRDKLNEVLRNSNDPNFFETLLSVLAQCWRVCTLEDIVAGVFAKRLAEPRDPIGRCFYLILQCWVPTITLQGLSKISEPITKLKHLVVGWELLAWLLMQFVFKNFSHVPQGERATIKHTFKEFVDALQTQTRIEDLAAVLGNTPSKFRGGEREGDFLDVQELSKELCQTFSRQLLESCELRSSISKLGISSDLIIEAVADELVRHRKEDEAIKMLIDYQNTERALVLLLNHFDRLTQYGRPNEGETSAPMTSRMIEPFNRSVNLITLRDEFLNNIRKMLKKYFKVISTIQGQYNEDELAIQSEIRSFVAGWEHWKTARAGNISDRFADIPEDCDRLTVIVYTYLLSAILESCSQLKDAYPDADLSYLAGISTLVSLLSESNEEVRRLFVLSSRYAQQVIQSLAGFREPPVHDLLPVESHLTEEHSSYNADHGDNSFGGSG